VNDSATDIATKRPTVLRRAFAGILAICALMIGAVVVAQLPENPTIERSSAIGSDGGAGGAIEIGDVDAAPSTTSPTTPTATAPATTTVPTTTVARTRPTTVPAPGVLWSESFDTEAGMDRMVFDIDGGRTGGEDGPPIEYVPLAFNGDHDHSCGGPLTSRSLVEDHEIDTHVWWCAPGNDPAKGHFMTGVNAGGYIILSFSPKDDATGTAQVFPETANRVCWDQNVTDLGGRKWTQLIIVGEQNFLANDGELDYLNPGNPGNFAFQNLPSGDDLSIKFLFSSVEAFSGQQLIFQDFSGIYGVTDKATRYRFCVSDNGSGEITVTEDRPDGPWSTTFPGAFPAGPRVFLFGDDTYNAEKSWEEQGLPIPTDRFTWHWDNITVETV
jgi:hypothetical protein